MESNYFMQIIGIAWNIFNTEFTLYGFTLSYGKVFIFALLVGLAARAISILWG